MDARHFDRLTRALGEAGKRRGLLGLLTTSPVVGGLFIQLAGDEADARGRRKRRKKRHKHGKGRRKQHKKCNAESRARTCSGTCGNVVNNCHKIVDCGSCDCDPPCAECFTCQGADGAPGTCVPQDAGTPCGASASCENGTLVLGGSCNGAGMCQAGAEVSCAPYLTCAGDACATTCERDNDCTEGSFCNDDHRCAGDQDNGLFCEHGGQCASGFCVDDVCCESTCNGVCFACDVPGFLGACAPDPVEEGEHCGSQGQICQPDGACACTAGSCPDDAPICGDGGACAGCSGNGDCAEAGRGNLCCAGRCFTGVCCADATCTTAEAPDCVGHDCVCAANSNATCAAGRTCCDDGCANLKTDPANCGSCGSACLETTPVCANGGCVACSAENPCPPGQCCAADGSCGASCPACHTCAGGLCAVDAGKDRSCCAGDDGEQWCQAGACVPIPADARATLAECGGRCDCVPYGDNTCGNSEPQPWHASHEICGASRLCPLCEQCDGMVSGCDDTALGRGVAGQGFYCIFEEELGPCSGGSCPNPQREVCVAGDCYGICGVTTG